VRVIAVLGYSGGRSDGLDPVCAQRLRHAEAVAADADAVVLTGSGRRQEGAGEAELMREAWRGPAIPLVSDGAARNTAENAAAIAAAATELGADEVVVVTSRWHALRAGLLVRAALSDPSVTVRTSSPLGFHAALLVRELACSLVLPYHLRRARGSGVERR
jgi:uncharacterized SAM-binding protein YcdF (DUF218 family)